MHESIFDEFTSTFVKRAAATVVGNGMEAGVEMGPLANDRRVPVLTNFVEDARAKGATVATGGERLGNTGYFFQPTVLVNVPAAVAAASHSAFVVVPETGGSALAQMPELCSHCV